MAPGAALSIFTAEDRELKLVCISDTHGLYDFSQMKERGDVLVIAGDSFRHHVMNCRRNPQGDALGQLDELHALDAAVGKLGFAHALIVAGNHDWIFQALDTANFKIQLRYLRYLEDEECVIDGVKFYGFPWTPEFCGWAFMRERRSKSLKHKVMAIDDDTDVLISHGPPWGLRDRSYVTNGHVGCELLREKIDAMVNLKYVICGHIHGARGSFTANGKTIWNVSCCTEEYHPLNPPVVLELETGQKAAAA